MSNNQKRYRCKKVLFQMEQMRHELAQLASYGDGEWRLPLVLNALDLALALMREVCSPHGD